MSARETVLTAATALFLERKPTAVGDHFGPSYVQHSTLAEDGLDGLRALQASLPDGFSYELVRAITEGDLVVLHGIYTGFGPVPLVAFDVFRADGYRVIEHWDSLTPVVTATASGRTQTDGTMKISDLDKTVANKALIAEFAQKVLIGADYSALANYISTE